MRVITWNTRRLPSGLGLDRGPGEPTQVGEALVGYDLICLQEMFDNSDREDILDAFADEVLRRGETTFRTDFPYYYYLEPFEYMPFEHDRDLDDSGTVILSRYPIVSSWHTIYDEHASSDSWVAKGAQYARIQLKEGLFIDVVCTHLQADYPDDGEFYPSIRQSQLRQLTGALLNVSNAVSYGDLQPAPLLLMGDFNLTGDTSEYNTMLSILGPDERFGAPSSLPVYDLGRFSGPTLSGSIRIDYILLKPAQIVVDEQPYQWLGYGDVSVDRMHGYSDHSAVTAVIKMKGAEKPMTSLRESLQNFNPSSNQLDLRGLFSEHGHAPPMNVMDVIEKEGLAGWWFST